MKSTSTASRTLSLMAGGLLLLGFITSVSAADLTEYKRLAEDTIKQAQSGRIHNIDQLIAQQEKLVAIGVAACDEYADKHPKAKRILGLVTSNAESMKHLSLSEIEEKWHHGGELKKNGYEVKEDHFGQVGNLIDAVIHPATTYIALTNYKNDGNKDHLEQVVAELSEVLVHLQYLE
jgi:hypothetical protein